MKKLFFLFGILSFLWPVPLPADSLPKDLGKWFAKGETSQIEAAVKEGLQKDPSDSWLWLELASLRKSQGDYEGAATAYRSYLSRMDPAAKDAWRVQAAMGLALTRGGKWRDADSVLQALYSRHPKDGEVLWGLSLLKIHQAKLKATGKKVSQKALEEARDLLRDLTAQNPRFVPAVWELAEVLRLLKDLDGALREYQQVVKLDGSYKQAYPPIARILAAKKQYSQALVKFEQVMVMDPENKSLRKEAQRVSQNAPKAASQRKRERMREWEEWRVPEERPLAASPTTIRVGIFTPLANLLLRGESDLRVTFPGQSPQKKPLAVLSARKGYHVVYLPAGRSVKHKPSWVLKDSQGGIVLDFDRRIWITPADPKKSVALHAVPSNVGYFFAREEDKAYRGTVEISPRPKEGFQVINRISLEDYTAGVLPSEMPSYWPLEALKAQAVVARTYALSKMGRHNSQGFDVCDTVHCEVYGGLREENGKSDQAVNETADQVLKKGNRLLPVVFSAQCGGHTQNYREQWGYDAPIVGVPDYGEDENKDMDFPLSPLQLETWVKENRKANCLQPELKGYRNYRWAAVVSAPDLGKKAPGIGRPRRLLVTSRSEAGWAERLRVEGEHGIKEVKGDYIRSFLGGIRSNLFWIETQFDGKGWPEEFVIYGGGWGHGVGLCQVGAYGLAKKGETCAQILYHYFPKAEIGAWSHR